MGKREYNKERYEWLKSRKICTNCANEDAYDGGILCPECYEKRMLSYKPLTNTQRLDDNAKKRLRRQTLINLRCCTQCCAKLSDLDGTRCKPCAEKHRKRTKPYAMTREQAIYRGICVQCKKNKVVENRTICASCLEAGRKQIEMMNQRRKMKKDENNKKKN